MYKFLVVIFFIIWSTNSFAFSNESNKYQNEITEFADRIERKMKSDKDLEIISEKIWFQRGQAPFKYFVNKEFVRKKEKKALEKLQNHWAVNQREYLKIENKYFPFNTPYFEKYFASTFSIFIDLYDGKISYGEFHKMKKELLEKTQESAQEAWKFKQANQTNKFNQINKTLQDYLITQKLINEVFQPARRQSFVCTHNGNIINCW
jgi:hypothetical protein